MNRKLLAQAFETQWQGDGRGAFAARLAAGRCAGVAAQADRLGWFWTRQPAGVGTAAATRSAAGDRCRARAEQRRPRPSAAWPHARRTQAAGRGGGAVHADARRAGEPDLWWRRPGAPRLRLALGRAARRSTALACAAGGAADGGRGTADATRDVSGYANRHAALHSTHLTAHRTGSNAAAAVAGATTRCPCERRRPEAPAASAHTSPDSNPDSSPDTRPATRPDSAARAAPGASAGCCEARPRARRRA